MTRTKPDDEFEAELWDTITRNRRNMLRNLAQMAAGLEETPDEYTATEVASFRGASMELADACERWQSTH